MKLYILSTTFWTSKQTKDEQKKHKTGKHIFELSPKETMEMEEQVAPKRGNDMVKKIKPRKKLKQTHLDIFTQRQPLSLSCFSL
jgi:hypothetical protein